MKNFFWKFFFLLLILLGIGIGIYFWNFKKKPKTYEFQTISATNITQKVSVTGKVKPLDTADLTFENNGKIQAVNVKVGDHVKSGTLLVRLLSEDLLAQKNEALANLKQARAQLKEAKNGNRNEEVKIQSTKKESSNTAVKNAEQDLETEIKEALSISQFIVRNTINNLTDNPAYAQAEIVFFTTQTQKLNEINNRRFNLNRLIDSWETEMKTSMNSDLEFAKNKAQKNLEVLKNFVDDLVLITPTFAPTPSQTQSKLDQWINVMNATQNNINTEISQIKEAWQAILMAKKSLDTSKEELHLTQVGVREEQIEMHEASVQAAEARVAQIQAQINKTVLYAPFDGIITKVNAKKGEVISLMTAKEILVSMIGEGYEIELNVPEIDVNKIKIEDPVEIKFDAFDDRIFESRVKFIEPAETSVQGVTYYQVKVALNPEEIDLEVRSGMSVEVDIITEHKENIIKIPQRRVIRDENDKIVKIVEGNAPNQNIVEVLVETGIRDDEGNIEILKGLNVGDKLLLE